MATYDFRPVEPGDLTTIRRWLDIPHVAEWWRDPPDIQMMSIREHLSDPTMECRLMLLGANAIGYLQSYDPHGKANHPYADQPQWTRGIDQFIALPKYIGVGHGSSFVRIFAERAFDNGIVRVIADPDPANARAIRAYEKAGFHSLGRRQTSSGTVLLMACDRATK